MLFPHPIGHEKRQGLRPVYSRPVTVGRKPCQSVRQSSRTAIRCSPSAAARSTYELDPLYLFHCAVEWHSKGDTAAGWELVQAMRSEDRGVRALAAELLAETENGRLRVRDLRRTRGGLHDIRVAADGRLQFGEQVHGEASQMKTPYGLQMVEDCNTCRLKKTGWFCSLSSGATSSLSEFSHLTTYPGNAILFIEGQMPRGAFVLCSGKVKLSTASREGKVLVFKMVEPGEVIGLSAMISGDAYQVTAETVGPCLVNFVEREGLLRLMERSGELGLRSALAVSRDFQAACRDIHDLILARSSSGKLARLLLSWVNRDLANTQDLRFTRPSRMKRWHKESALRARRSRGYSVT